MHLEQLMRGHVVQILFVVLAYLSEGQLAASKHTPLFRYLLVATQEVQSLFEFEVAHSPQSA